MEIDSVDEIKNSIININVEGKSILLDSVINNLYIRIDRDDILVTRDLNITFRINCNVAFIFGFKPEDSLEIDNKEYKCFSASYAKFQIEPEVYECTYFPSTEYCHDYYLYIENFNCDDLDSFLFSDIFYNIVIDNRFDEDRLILKLTERWTDKNDPNTIESVNTVTIKESLTIKNKARVEFNNLVIEGDISTDPDTEIICKSITL